MPSISGTASTAAIAKNEKRTEEHTRTMQGVMELLYSEVRRLRLGDESDVNVNLLRQ